MTEDVPGEQAPEVQPTPEPELPSETPAPEPEPEAEVGAPEDPEPSQTPAEDVGELPAEEEEVAPEPLEVGPEAFSKRLAISPLGVVNDKPNKRVSGSDRFATAVAISKHSYTTASTVIVATGMDYPDSLSAAPLAAKLRAPLLLTLSNSLPKVTRDEIKRLKPKSIIIVGGAGVVNASVEKSLKSLVSKTERLSGKDRYATSAAVAKRGWNTTSSGVFVATGEGYADALSAGAAAGKLGVPVILVPGSKGSAPAVVRNEINRLKPSRLYIAGGTGVVSVGMQKAISNGRAVTRFSGTDRFDTSAKIANGIFSGTTRSTYLANGLDFADALTGAAAAGAEGSPLLLSWDHCIPSNVYSANDNRKANDTFLLGGAGVLGGAIRNGNECMSKPKGISSQDWTASQKLYSYINYYRYTSGRAGARVADATRGTPAQTWSNRKSVKINSGLKPAQPWVRYEGIVRSKAGGDRAKAVYNRFMKESDAKKWIHRPTSGTRTFVSVGYTTSGSYSYSTVYVGTGLK